MENKINQPTPSSNVDVHTMPKKFTSSKADGKKAKVIGLVIIISVLVVALVAAAFYLNSVLKKDDQSEAQVSTNQPAEKSSNQNKNTNQAKNEINKNENKNVNTNINTNTNTDANANTNVNTNTNVSLPSSQALPNSLDSDSDGLTDEEEGIYGTNINEEDFDGDSYLDGQEILGGYNPVGSGKLVDSGLVDTFSNPSYNYSIIYPIDWIPEVVNDATQEVRFSSQTGEFIQVFVQDNPKKLSALNWYLQQWPGLQSSQVKKITVGNLSGVWSLEELTVYLVKDDQLYVINYSVDEKKEMNFKTTFDMMIRSFELTD